MDIVTLKRDFYKHFDSSHNSLINEKCGMLCTLLGNCDIRGSYALTCTLSMGVKAICRRLNGDAIKITNSRTGDIYTYHISDFSDTDKLCGAQILLDTTIPPYLRCHFEKQICLTKCILGVNHISDFNKITAASSLAKSQNIKPYLALFEARKGYAVFSHKLNTELIPLPLSGYKFIFVQLMSKKSVPRRDGVRHAFDIVSHRYPHVSTFYDLTPEIMHYAKKVLDSASVKRLAYLKNESHRILRAVDSLRALRIKDLFKIINESALDYAALWDNSSYFLEFIAFAHSCDGVFAARPFENGILCIADENSIDRVTSSFYEYFRYTKNSNIRFCISD